MRRSILAKSSMVMVGGQWLRRQVLLASGSDAGAGVEALRLALEQCFKLLGVDALHQVLVARQCAWPSPSGVRRWPSSAAPLQERLDLRRQAPAAPA